MFLSSFLVLGNNCPSVSVGSAVNDAEGEVVSDLQRNGCYSQGNVKDFNKFLSKEVGKEDFKVCGLIKKNFSSKFFNTFMNILKEDLYVCVSSVYIFILMGHALACVFLSLS